MNQRYQPDYSRSRPGSRPNEDYYRGMRSQGAFDHDLDDWNERRYYGASPSAYADDGYGEPGMMNRPGAQYAEPYGQPRGGQRMQAQDRNRQYSYNSPYGPDDFRQGSGQRQWQQGEFNRQGQRQFAGQGGRASSNLDQNFGYGNFRQQRYQPASIQPVSSRSGYARDFDEGDFDQAFGGYSPSQRGYGDSWSGYGSGGYGTQYGAGYDDEFMGTSNAPVQSGAFGQGPGGYGGGYSQGLAGRGGYGAGSGYTGSGYGGNESDYGASLRQSQFGRGPKGYTRPDERIREQISDRLMRDHYVDASDIEVEVRNGKVTLSGSIDDRGLKHYVEDTIEQCLGVTDVDNRLTVKPRGSQLQGGSGSLGGSTGSNLGYPVQGAAGGTAGSRVPGNSSTPGANAPNGEDGGGTGRSRN